MQKAPHVLKSVEEVRNASDKLKDKFEQLCVQFGQIEKKYDLIINREVKQIVRNFSQSLRHKQ